MIANRNGNHVGRLEDLQNPQPLTELMDRQLPMDLEAEVAVLGSIFLEPRELNEIVTVLQPRDFCGDANQIIYRHMCALHEAGEPIDDILLVDSLKKAGDYERVGAAAYVSKIVNAVPNYAHARYYAGIVQEKARLRRLIYNAAEILRDAFYERPSVEVAAHLARASDEERATRQQEEFYESITLAGLRDIKAPEYLIPGILETSQCGVIAGQFKSLKTTIAAELAYCLVTGADFLGRFTPERTARVGMFSGEARAPQFWKLFRRIGAFSLR
jgi:DnaB helicase-like protein/AAA domain-containing protein